MSSNEPKSARKELLRYLRLGKSVRSRQGANLVRNFILETQADAAIHRLCRSYQINVSELCLAGTEILDSKPDPFREDKRDHLVYALQFSDPLRLEVLLKKLQRATHGQALIQRRLVIIECAKSHAEQMAAPVPGPRKPATRSNLLKISIFNKLLLMALIAVLVIAGILLAILLL